MSSPQAPGHIEWTTVVQEKNVPAETRLCRFCHGTQLLRTRLRASDITHMLLLQFPVRCGRCNQRQYTNFLFASLAGLSYINFQPRSRPHDDWRDFTANATFETPPEPVAPVEPQPYVQEYNRTMLERKRRR